MVARGRDLGRTGMRAGSTRAAARIGGTVMSASDEPLVYKASEVARALDTTIQSVHKLIKRRELLALDLRVKGSPKPTYRITRESFEAYVAGCRR